jgi:hypothetical protein
MRNKLIIFCLVLFAIATVNAQDNWMLTPSFPSGGKTAMAAMQDSVFFVGTSNGIHRSGTTGNSWRKVLNTSAIYSLHASASGKIVAGSEGKMYISFNKGLTWDSVKLQTRFPVKEIAESPNGNFYFITGVLDASTGYVGDGVFYNAGDLKTWINKTPGLYHTGYCERIKTDRFNRVYVTMGDEYVTGQAGLFISDNKGDTWSRARLFVNDLGDVKTANTFSVNITPTDSVILSVAGTVANFSVSLNLIKHRDDLLNNDSWKLITVRNTSSWWMDLLLNPIHFAANGSWYSSITNSPSQGGVFVSTPGGRAWSKYNAGLAAATSTQFESFSFYEDSYGRIFASQFLDEKIYITTRSMLNVVTISGKIADDQGSPLSVKIENTFFPIYSDFLGEYKLKVPRSWSGDLTPNAYQYSFEPTRISVGNVQQDLVNQNFTGTYTGTHSVWGFVKDAYGYPVSDVVVTGFEVSLKTNEYGAFSVAVPHGWSGEISLTLDRLEITPATLKIEPVYKGIYAFEFIAKEKGKFIVSGKVKDAEGLAITDALIEGLPENNRLNSEGEYVAVVPEGWSGEIKVTHLNYVFTPVSHVIQNLSADIADQNFVGIIDNLNRVSGVIKDNKLSALPGVTLLGLPQEAKTNESGKFEVQLPAGWSGTITPVLNDYKFEPESITISNLNEDRVGLNFSANFVGKYTLSGFIKLADGTALSEIILNGFLPTLKTDGTGFFSATVPAGWSGTIIPVSTEFIFTPASIEIVNLDQSKSQLNFEATVITQVPDEPLVLEVFPNPSSDGVVQIHIMEVLQSARITVTSLTGQVIHRYEPGTFKTFEKIQLPQQGIFILTLTQGNQSYIRKIIVR